MNDEVQDALCPNGCKSIIDTGTYLIYGPSDQLQSFLSDMTIKTCDDKANLPNLGFMFKGFKKDGKDTAFELILTPDEYVLEFDVDGKPDCVVGIGSDTEDSGWTLGQVFLKAYYTVFDRDSEAIGFVKANPNPQKIVEKEVIEMEKNNGLFKNNFVKNIKPVLNSSKTKNSQNFVNNNTNFKNSRNFVSNNLPDGPIISSTENNFITGILG